MDMSRHLEEHLDLCAGFALESLDPADRARLNEHLDQGCEVCEQALREYGGTTLLLASAAPVAQPDPGLRERVLSAARALAAPAEPRAGAGRVIELGLRRFPRWTALAWAAAAALAGGRERAGSAGGADRADRGGSSRAARSRDLRPGHAARGAGVRERAGARGPRLRAVGDPGRGAARARPDQTGRLRTRGAAARGRRRSGDAQRLRRLARAGRGGTH